MPARSLGVVALDHHRVNVPSWCVLLWCVLAPREPIWHLSGLMPSKPLASLTKLDLGCGKKQFPDHVNVDLAASVGPDVVHDLDQYP